MIDDEQRGTVLAVALSDTRSFPKYPQESVTVGANGFVGDAHAGELRPSHSNPKVLKPNDRAVSIIADEVRREVNEKLGLAIEPGGFNENILVSGYGDLSQLQGGELILFDGGVVLRVSEQSLPCQTLEENTSQGIIKATVHRDEQGRIVNKRGVVATVVQTGELKTGETFVIHEPLKPELPA